MAGEDRSSAVPAEADTQGSSAADEDGSRDSVYVDRGGLRARSVDGDTPSPLAQKISKILEASLRAQKPEIFEALVTDPDVSGLSYYGFDLDRAAGEIALGLAPDREGLIEAAEIVEMFVKDFGYRWSDEKRIKYGELIDRLRSSALLPRQERDALFWKREARAAHNAFASSQERVKNAQASVNRSMQKLIEAERKLDELMQALSGEDRDDA